MTIEMGGFIGLAALMVGLFAWLRQDIARLETTVSKVESRMDAQTSELRERMAKLEGLLEGLREAITGRRAA